MNYSASSECLLELKAWLFYLRLRGAFNKFPDFFVAAFKIGVDSWKYGMLLLYIL